MANRFGDEQTAPATSGNRFGDAPHQEQTQQRSWMDSVGDFAKGFWGNMSATGEGMVNAVKHPVQTIKDIGTSQDAVRLKAEDAFKRGDYAEGVRHVMGYLIPVAGPGIDASGDKAQQGKVAEALGEATSTGLQMAVPGALKGATPGVVSAVEAVKKVPAKIVSAATNPVVRDIAGIVSPRLAHGLSLANKLKKVVAVLSEEANPTPAPPAAPVPVAEAPVAPPVAPPVQPQAPAPKLNPQQLAQQLADEMVASGTVPREAVRLPNTPEAPPPAAPAPPQSAPVPQGTAGAAQPPARTIAQVEADMARKSPAPTETPGRSGYSANGEAKSPRLRAEEIRGANVDAKAKRFAEALHQFEVTSGEVAKIPTGRLSAKQITEGGSPAWGNVVDDLMAKGVLKQGETVPSQSIPKIIRYLKEMELAKKKPAALAGKPKAQEIAAQLAEEMRRSGTLQ